MIKNLSLFFLVFMLFACAKNQINQGPLSLSWAEREIKLSAMLQWQFHGDFLLNIPNHKIRAGLSWKQEKDQYSLIFFGPFGLVEAKLDGDAHLVHLKDNKGNDYSADNPETLIKQQFACSLPLSSLYYWVRGLPSPAEVQNRKDDLFHRIEDLEQEGWHIHYIAYQRVQDLELPQEIQFKQDDLTLDLMIDKGGWKLG